MAKKRKFCAYRKLERAYTRKSKFKKKSFVRSSPQVKIVKFDMGNLTKKDWQYKLELISKDDLQIRDNAFESARQLSNKFFETKIGKENYHFRIKAFPHHMLRENPLASGAGADRMSTGMKMSFGKVIGIAARIYKGKTIIEVETDKEFVERVKIGLIKASKKLPGSCTIQVKELKPVKKTAVAA